MACSAQMVLKSKILKLLTETDNLQNQVTVSGPVLWFQDHGFSIINILLHINELSCS